jgi:hypothetical protein
MSFMRERPAEFNRKSPQVELFGIHDVGGAMTLSRLRRYWTAATMPGMDEPDQKPPRHYRWPWWVLAAFLLGVALAVLWMVFDVRTIEQERNFNTPPPANPAP